MKFIYFLLLIYFMTKVIKRSGEEEEYLLDKLYNALIRAGA